ncbi:MAG: twin-arginine translocase TatA/TatE family subunit [Candidatus Lernaella stagnicola]|nr:twin-arginine translocase TatA/TatE family subunit [Candidatus Lernaella stagnicola]
MFFGGLGPWELIIILVIVLIIFGVGKLPEVGRGLGKGIREFKEATKDGILTDGDKPEDEKKETPAEVKVEAKVEAKVETKEEPKE